MYNSAVDFSLKTFNENNKTKINKRLLKILLAVQAPSGEEGLVANFILAFIHANRLNCKFDFDTEGNLLVTKGEADIYPCICAHMDEVNAIQSDRTIIEFNNVLIGMNKLTGEYAGVGGDDKVGVYLALEALIKYDNIKVAFFVEEEKGCIGSNKVDLDFFKDVAFIFQSDRKGDDEVLTYSNGVDLMDQNFKDLIKPSMDLYKYKFGTGTATDVGCLIKREVGVLGFNIGSGYFQPHSLEEKVCISSVENMMNLTFNIIDLCLVQNKRFEYVPKKVEYAPYSGGSYYSSKYGLKANKAKNYLKRELTAEEESVLSDYFNPNYWENFEYK